MREQTIWLPVDITAIGLEWAEMKSAEISRAAFLFGDSLPAIRKSARRPSASAQAEPTAQIPVKPRYIFHTAFCCSTLLARSLDREGVSLAVKEPDILMKLANLERNQPGIAARLVPTIETGLFQHPGFDERIVVKPTNAANRIIPHLMQNTAARAIIIHSDLESFLLSIARKGEEGRIFVRRLYNIFLADTPFAQSLNARDVFTFSDLQIAAFVWAMQCAQIEAAVSLAPDRYRLLHCDLFLADPEPVLGRGNAFLGQGHVS